MSSGLEINFPDPKITEGCRHTYKGTRMGLKQRMRTMVEIALKEAAEARRQAFIDAVAYLWDLGELYMIDVPRHLQEERLVIWEQSGIHAPRHIHERGWIVWTPWGAGWRNGSEHILSRPEGAVEGWVVFEGGVRERTM